MPILIVVMLAVSMGALAADHQRVDPARVTPLMVVAAKLSGRPATALPPVYLMPRAVVCLTASGGPDCSTIGLYQPARGEIWLVREDVDLDTAFGRSVLVHELVHHLQGGEPFAPGDTCYQAEREAYSAQRRYLQQQGVVVKDLPDDFTVRVSCLPS